MIAACVNIANCKSEYQDQKYGKGKRVLNPSKKSKNGTCTVCGTRQ